MMPEMDGFELAAEIRRQDKSIPILFMTARDDMSAKQKGYSLGIDDYMVKPIEMDELLLRVSALLRRANIRNERKLEVGSLVLNEEETTAYLNGEEVSLTVREFNILFKLLSYPKRTFTRAQLMDEFWGYDTESTPRTVDVSITKLRDKLSDCADVEIVTVRGLGYKAVIKG
jgi:DNA-binding response OmpR family regulator